MERAKFCLLDLDYVVDNDKPVIRLWGKDEKGKSVVVLDRNFRPYFYMDVSQDLIKDIPRLKKRISQLRDSEGKELDLEARKMKLLGKERDFIKITLQNPRDIPNIRRIVKDWDGVRKTYENGINFYRRYLIDHGMSPYCWLEAVGKGVPEDFQVERVIEAEEIKKVEGEDPEFSAMAIDIETVKDSIIMASYMTSGGGKGVLTYDWGELRPGGVEVLGNEKGMLERLMEIIKENDPDIVVTYNGDLFDFDRIRKRCDKYNVNTRVGRDRSRIIYTKRGRIFSAKIPGRVHVDLYNFVERILGDSLESDTFTLDMVSREMLGEGKDGMRWSQIRELWKEKKGLERVANYCLRDSELTLKLAERILPRISELSALTSQTLFDVGRMSYSQLVEWTIIKRAFVEKEIVLNRPKYDEIKRRRKASSYTGGYVYPPEAGIHHTISLFDFTSLYPSIIITHNISPESLNRGSKRDREENSVPGEEGHFFGREKKGFISSIIEELVKKRIEIKRELENHKDGSKEHRDLYSRQYALKIIANAIYGYYAYAGSRWYSRICAKSITAWGRHYIQKVIEFAKNRNFRVIYGDTDSLFLERCSKSKAGGFVKDVNENLPETMGLEFVNSYKSGLFVETRTGTTAKKRYALLDKRGNIKVKGFEKVRRDWSQLARDTQESVLEAILKENDQNKAVNIVEKTIEDLKSGDVEMKKLVIHNKITRPLENYDQIGPHVAAARKYVEKGHVVTPGSMIGYVITRGNGSISSRAEPAEYAENYDPDYYIKHQIIPAAMRILNSVGLSEEELEKEEPGQKFLDSYMKKSLMGKIKDKWIRK